MPATLLANGFDDPVFDSQAAFRTAMWALARPGRVEPIITALTPPAPLNPEAAALVLALCDYETPLWLDAALARVPEVGDFLRFHTGAPIVTDAREARFALIAEPADMPDFSDFAQGSPEYPDASATLIVQVEAFTGGLVLEGPGIKGRAAFGATPLPADIVARLAENRALFPLGVDLLLAGPGGVAGLPRSVTVKEG
ncbi:alpha-D-ribose 1-methylphosphonate 5-triphosphate synthase subunit PhnH [Ancylobacter aquaticus]|uniref:Alpha-D-ribose 1-methylphosphonate 5-triphosphate synthase subunit PhnH n=1 Tax=Ancylobacter aquaticus TaxID=100 RepID=A0A4R1I4L8_ANCAQ|nr:phosphonate C-P lyase system protein PhnH [Ancylobacter aquaticus]TCK28971.1 alpha-D-ribose 1-methylphosphonate 5-triphosphate synthase subunit PhnH [Ancylobacter aquaticus]